MINPVTLPREVVEQALETLEEADLLMEHRQNVKLRRSALVTLRAALEQPDHSEQSYMEGVTAGRHELASEYPLPTDLYDSKDWRCGTYAERVEWLHTMYEAAKEQIAALEQPQGERRPLKNELIRLIESSTHFHESMCWAIRFARAIEAAHGIGSKE